MDIFIELEPDEQHISLEIEGQKKELFPITLESAKIIKQKIQVLNPTDDEINIGLTMIMLKNEVYEELFCDGPLKDILIG